MKYDYLIVGSGLFGSIFAYEANKRGKKVLVIDKRSNIAGNIYTENKDGINVHKYGAHIFHTSDKEVWKLSQKIPTKYMVRDGQTKYIFRRIKRKFKSKSSKNTLK